VTKTSGYVSSTLAHQGRQDEKFEVFTAVKIQVESSGLSHRALSFLSSAVRMTVSK
jgi:hypothetical protein